jgi:hypothetical protein
MTTAFMGEPLAQLHGEEIVRPKVGEIRENLCECLTTVAPLEGCHDRVARTADSWLAMTAPWGLWKYGGSPEHSPYYRVPEV